MELLAILLVAVGGFALLAVRRHRRDSHDAAVTESAGTGWRFRSELPHDVGPPFSYFAPDLWLVGPSDVMEGTEEGFEVAYFTVADGHRTGQRQWPAAIVQLPIEVPNFRYFAEDLDDKAPTVLRAMQHGTPPHHDTGRAGRVGDSAAALLSSARSVIVETSLFAVWIRSKGASAEDVSRLTIALAKALVADANAASQPTGP